MTEMLEKTAHRYLIDAGRGSFTVQAFAKGLLSFVGHNPTFAVRRFGGEIEFSDGKADRMLVVIKSNSLSLIDRMSEKDTAEIENTMRKDVLETERFPEIVFVSQDIAVKQIADENFAVKANGVLIFHGEKIRQTIEAEADISNENIRARGELFLNQSDFGIKPVKALGGTLKVKDAVQIRFDISARI